MSKKLITACMAIAAFAAFALPATASATNDPQLTEGGTLVTGEPNIVGTASNTLFLDTSGNTLVTCSTAVMTGKLTKNSGSTVEGSITSAKFSGSGPVHSHNGLNECTGTFGNAYITVGVPLVIKSTPTMATDEFQVTGTGAGGTVIFTIGSTTAGACEYQTNSSVKGDASTGGSEAKLTVRATAAGSGAKLIKGGFLCPSSGMLSMTFGLETEDGTKLTIS
jgi:hypothetical protein